MSTTPSTLQEAFLQGWREYQDQLVVVVGSLTPEELELRVTPELRSAGEAARHIITARANWFHGVLNEGDEEIAAIDMWEEKDQPTRTSTELVRGLQATWNLILDCTSRWTTQQLGEPIILPWIGEKYPISRAWVLWHVLEHDLHVGGEMTQTLGLSRLDVKLPPPPPDV